MDVDASFLEASDDIVREEPSKRDDDSEIPSIDLTILGEGPCVEPALSVW